MDSQQKRITLKKEALQNETWSPSGGFTTGSTEVPGKEPVVREE
jgi:hypothetical protein